jgi:uroporphyrinogen-III decarboxylase
MTASNPDITRMPLTVVCLGVDMFADSLAEQGIAVVRVDWRPPAEEAEAAFDLLPLLED